MATDMLPENTLDTAATLPSENPPEANPTQKKKKKKKKRQYVSGFLSATATLLLQTRVALTYFNGRQGAVGVPYFGALMKTIWHAAASDDPYADLFLLRIYDALIQTGRELEAQEKRVLERLNQAKGIKFTLASNPAPIKLRLQFTSPYGYLGAELIRQFDRCARVILSARFFGIRLHEPSQQLLYTLGNQVQKVFSLPQQWQATGVTRSDMQRQTPSALKAIERMGPLNEQVLAKTLRAPFAPDIKTPPAQNK